MEAVGGGTGTGTGERVYVHGFQMDLKPPIEIELVERTTIELSEEPTEMVIEESESVDLEPDVEMDT